MLSIGQLASYAGVTVRAVRHYHQIGLLPEPARDVSGYRSYGADAVVRLVRIRTLANAGVPLARVQQLLDADEKAYVEAIGEIDRDLRRQIRELQAHRRQIARLTAGDALAVPDEVREYLDLVRATGAPEQLIDAERDAWILVAARYPTLIQAFMADKVAQLQDPRTVRFYQLISRMVDGSEEQQEELILELVDLLVELFEEAAANGELEQLEMVMDDDGFVQLLDSASDAQPIVARLRELLAERGWSGWTRIERAT